MKPKSFAASVCLVVALSAPVYAGDGVTEVTLIHTGDFHGHLIPRANVRSDAVGNSTEGGLARIYTKIKQLRAEDPNALLIHTGDTIQGSAEVMYTRGDAIINVLNHFGIDAFAPGNWEFVYGTDRFLELFGPGNTKTNWPTIAANVFYTADRPDYAPKAGQRVTPAYVIKQVGDVKVGILGLTTDRGPQVVGSAVTRGFRFLVNGTQVDAEVSAQINHLRNVEQVDVLVMASEMGLANNIRLAKKYPGIDVVLSSDMHEETTEPAVVTHANGTQTLVVEEGQDGTMMGRIKLKVKNGKVVKWHWNRYRVLDDIPEDATVAALVAEARRTFVAGPDFTQHTNPFNGSKLLRPIDAVVGYTAKPLHRSNFAHEDMPGVIEGSSHDMMTDAFKAMTGAQIGAIRGFRYGTHVPVGAIKMEDLYHFMPIGAQIAKGTIKGQALKNQIESAAQGSLNPNVAAWTGGWLFNFSGVTMDFDPYAANNARATNIKVNGSSLVLTGDYSYASYWYKNDPCLINVVPIPGCTATGGVPSNITILKEANGDPLDGAEVVARYIESQVGQTVDPVLNRITLTAPLPPYRYGFPEVQPLWGAQP